MSDLVVRNILKVHANNKVNKRISRFIVQRQNVIRNSNIPKELEGDLAEKKKALMRGKTHSGGLTTIL